MATAGHFAIQTPRSEAQTLNSINADDLSFPSPEPSFHSPKKQKQAAAAAVPQKAFLSRLTQPTGNTPLAEIKNNVFPRRSEFTPMLKSVTKNQFMKRGFMATPSRLGKSASTSDLPEMSQEMSRDEDVENSNIEGVTQNDENLVEMSSASVSGLKIPHRSPGSNDGAALMTLREQEKVYSVGSLC
jgi:hypothetical protein